MIELDLERLDLDLNLDFNFDLDAFIAEMYVDIEAAILEWSFDLADLNTLFPTIELLDI